MRARSPLNGAQASTPAALLTLAAVLSLLASACCVLPLLLVALGVSIAWLVPLRSFTSYWPLLIAGAAVALVLAKRRITSGRATCDSVGTICESRAAPYALAFWAIVTWTGVVLLVPLVAPLFY